VVVVHLALIQVLMPAVPEQADKEMLELVAMVLLTARLAAVVVLVQQVVAKMVEMD
jgi:hypothetical protein